MITLNLALFTIAQKHAAAVVKFREGHYNRFELYEALTEVAEEAKNLGVPYVLPDNVLDLVSAEDQYEYEYNSSDSYDYDEYVEDSYEYSYE